MVLKKGGFIITMLINHQTPYLIELESSSGVQLLANIVNHEILGLKIGANTIVPWLIKNTITDILEKDDNYLAKNMTQKRPTITIASKI